MRWQREQRPDRQFVIRRSAAFNAAITSVVNPSTKTGGTLKLSATGDCDAWDGANMYYAFCWDLSAALHA